MGGAGAVLAMAVLLVGGFLLKEVAYMLPSPSSGMHPHISLTICSCPFEAAVRLFSSSAKYGLLAQQCASGSQPPVGNTARHWWGWRWGLDCMGVTFMGIKSHLTVCQSHFRYLNSYWHLQTNHLGIWGALRRIPNKSLNPLQR